MTDQGVLFVGFVSSATVTAAVEALRRQGPCTLEVLGPHASAGVLHALDRAASRIPLLAGTCGLVGAGGAFALLRWIVHDYPLHVGGFALDMVWPFVPITFITGILVTAVVAFGSVLLATRLPDLHATADEEACLRRVGTGEWVLRVAASTVTGADLTELLQSHGARWQRRVQVDP